MHDFGDIKYVLGLLGKAQDSETDVRERANEAEEFVDDRGGQWEDDVYRAQEGSPRYTFDMTSPIIEQISGNINRKDFNVKVRPASGDATKANARIYDGLIRNIEAKSNSKHVYQMAARNVIVRGFDAWRVVQKYVDSDSFDQDLVIEYISDSLVRVWFDIDAVDQTKKDSKYVFVLTSLSLEKYKSKFKDGSGVSVDDESDGKCDTGNDVVVVGQIYYIKEKNRTLLRLSDGRIVEENEEFSKISDELEEQGVTIEDRRSRPKQEVYIRTFDGSDWLDEEKLTAFNSVPVVPCYANYKVSKNETTYRGIVEKMMDPQRVYNYSKSREISEGAMASRAKPWVTAKQVKGHQDSMATSNTNNNAFQEYNIDPEAPNPPPLVGGATTNPGLQQLSISMQNMMSSSSGVFAANLGENPRSQSGVAIDLLKDSGNIGTEKYTGSINLAVLRTQEIIQSAIKIVYDTKRQERVLSEDGSFSMETLNDVVIDEDTGEEIEVNNLSLGTYDVEVVSGPAYSSRRRETVASMLEAAAIDPSIIQTSGDILYSNMAAPGMDDIAIRKRSELWKAGLIPVAQWTKEEKQLAEQQAKQAQNTPPKPDPATTIAEAELIKAQNEQQKTKIDVQVKAKTLELAERKENREDAKVIQSGNENQFDQMVKMQNIQMEKIKFELEARTAQIDNLQTQVESLVGIRQAMGADSVISPDVVDVYSDQVEEISETQEQLT